MAAKFIATIALFAVTAFAGESVHLVNCGDGSSRIYYYSNDNNSPPSDSVTVTSGGYYAIWEGNVFRGTFAGSGVTYTSRINGNGQSVATYAFAGTGSNGYHNFNCYKDNKHTISGTNCQSIYYCFDA